MREAARAAWTLAVVVLAACASVSSTQLPAATPALVNPSFDEPGSGVRGWAERGTQFGQARIVSTPVASPPSAVELAVRAGAKSSGNESFMLYQVLDPAPYRGRKVRFGAKVRTQGGAINMTLFTPERTANDFFQTLDSGGYVDRAGVLDVPANASFLSFGIQIMGPSGARAYLDDVFVTAEGGAPPAPRGAGGGEAGRKDAEVRLDASQPGADVNPLIFGAHLEWTDAGNGLVDARSGELRRDVAQALADLRVPLFRFPGGIHADYYDWRPGAQPRGERPKAVNVFTGQAEPQAFGSPELIELSKLTGARLLLTANYGTGTPEAAGAWSRYFRDAGVPAAFWEVGNEIYLADPERDQPNGRRIARSASQYAADFPRFRAAIQAATPEAKVGIIGHLDGGAFALAPASRKTWTADVLAALGSRPDFVAVHNGYAPVIIDDSVRFDRAEERARVYRALYAAPADTEDNLAALGALLDRHATTRGLPLAITEWGPLYGYSSKPQAHGWYVDQSRTMAAAIYVASMLDVLLGQPRVLLATYTNPIHRWYGSLLTSTDSGLIRTPSYHVYSLYRTRFERRLIPVTVAGPVFESTAVGLVNGRRNAPAVLARASLSPDGRRLTAMLVNRSLDAPVSTRVDVKGFAAGRADCMVLAAATPNAINGPGLTSSTVSGTAIAPQPLTCTGGAGMTLSLPPSAVVSIVMERAR